MPHNVRLLTAWLFGPVILCLLPALCCRPEEYAAQDGQCCPMCREGTVVIGHCTEDSGTRCRPCANGTYMNQPNGETRCFLCSICHSAHGLLALQPCSSVSNSVCGAKPGFFCQRLSEGGSCEAAQKHSSCSPGQTVKEPGTSSADTVCEDCPQETFSPQGTNCTAWTRCAPGQTVKEPGTSSADTVCEDCPEETFSPQGTNCTAWTRCSEGEVVVRAGNRTEDVLCGPASRKHYGIIASFLFIVISVTLVVVPRVRGQPDLREEG